LKVEGSSVNSRGQPIKHNKLNDLYTKEWLKFQKSWFVHNPPPRGKNVLLHPAKFPESLVTDFIRFFSRPGEVVLDPMAGTGSAVVAAVACGRVGIGVELMDKYATIARERLDQELLKLRLHLDFDDVLDQSRIVTADAVRIAELDLPAADYCITSPPYWDMLRMQGWKNQKARRETEGLDVHYSDDERDVGNIEDYERFVSEVVGIYRQVAEVLREKAYLTVIVKNVKKGGTIYPLAWDIGREVGKFLRLKDERIWCQDNQRLAPYGMGKAWVSNTMHHYCLNFRKE
jgi:DNA modification methylase